MHLMTQAEFARHRGVTKGAVSNWKKAGLLAFANDSTGKMLVDVVRSDAKLNGNINPMRGRPTSGGSAAAGADAPALPLGEGAGPAPAAAGQANDLADERLQELRERRFGQAMKNAQLAGELVALIEAERRVAEIGRVARERVQAQLRGMAERLASESEPRTIMVLLEQAVDQVFEELADMAARGDFAGDDDDVELSADELAEQEAAAESDA